MYFMHMQVFETTHWKVLLNSNQMYFGRCVVVLKRDCSDLADVTKEEMLDFLFVVRRLETRIKNKLGATMFNWSCLMNNAYRDGETPQVHWHCLPRYKNPVRFGDFTITDPNFGFPNVRDVRNLTKAGMNHLLDLLS